jgi:sugar-phosphatase
LLEDLDGDDQPLLEVQAQIDLGELVAGALNVIGIFDDGIDKLLFGGERSKDGALRDTCGLSNLPSADIPPEPFQQRLGGRNERGSALIERHWGGASHVASLVSECSLSNGLSRRVILLVTLMPLLKRLSKRGSVAVSLGRLAEEVFEAVIFDLDGTLIDSTPAVNRAWNAWASEYGLAPTEVGRHHGVPSAAVVRAVMPEDRYEAAVKRIAELELADVHDIVVLPGATDALASLVDAKNAIATSCTVPLAHARITAAHMEPPTVIVTADDVANGKPHPEPFLEAARRLGVDPSRCLVVEDAPKGLEAAQAAGCFTLAVVTTTPREALEADAIVTDLSEVRFDVNSEGIRVRHVNAPPDTLLRDVLSHA